MVGRVGFEPTTNGLKVQIGKYNGLFINVLPRAPDAPIAVQCITMQH